MSDVEIRGVTSSPEKRNILRLHNAAGQMVVNIAGDGAIEFGPGFKGRFKGPKEAASLFWECVGGQFDAHRRALAALVEYVENHKVLKNADPAGPLVEAQKLLRGESSAPRWYVIYKIAGLDGEQLSDPYATEAIAEAHRTDIRGYGGIEYAYLTTNPWNRNRAATR